VQSLDFFSPLVPAQNNSQSTRKNERLEQGQLYVHPQYRVQRGIEALLKKVDASLDDYPSEKYQDGADSILQEWTKELLELPQSTAVFERIMGHGFSGEFLVPASLGPVRDDSSLKVWAAKFSRGATLGAAPFLEKLRNYLHDFSKLLTAEFQVAAVRTNPPAAVGIPVGLNGSPIATFETVVRFELVGEGAGSHREQRIGNWEMQWELPTSGEIKLMKWRALEETRCRAMAPVFVDIASQVFGGTDSYAAQLIHGTDHWRTVLDGASGIDIYGHNGIAVGDADGDGLDDIYVCQTAGLPNRLYRNRGDGTFEDATEAAGVGVIENTVCALFADVDNDGRQDLIVVRGSGPLLFLNQGAGKFKLKPNAFHFANVPQGTFTGAAMADYDRDGWLDIYFCLYSYYQGSGLYRYPAPYYDAENGPPNFMMRNNRDGSFVDVTKETGLDKNNTRFSFCCGWGDSNGDGWPDLYVVNDFGRKNLYRNNGDGTFTDIAATAGAEDVGAGMSVSWVDYDNDGKQDLYVANMWTAAGNRIAAQQNFQKSADTKARRFYEKHAMGNSLLRNSADSRFEDVTARSGTGMGRWAWSSDAWDFDHDGYPDLYVANGMISGTSRQELNSFFWRQIVANSPNDNRASHDYEQGWNAINELIRADGTWSGFERNVFFLNNRNGTFSDVSGVVGLDFIEDSRTFALGDFDGDGRLEVVLKNRNAPQVRFLKNVMQELPPAISFRLTGKKSNRDAIGAAVTIETEAGRQTKFLQAGSGFLAQHTKELHFGLGAASKVKKVSVRWPSGLVQELGELPANHRIWIEEGIAPSRMEAFGASKFSVNQRGSSAAAIETIPSTVETWLLAPVLAPDFSIADSSKRMQSISARRGKPVLLHCWSSATVDAESDLAEFDGAYSRWEKKGWQLVAVNVDGFIGEGLKRASVETPKVPFPVLNASADLIATYNLLFRFVFDRHRDMSLPTSFLIDEQGMIVKIYQGRTKKTRFEQDFAKIPRTPAGRIAVGLPFAGITDTVEFERNDLSLGSVFYERGYWEQAEVFCRAALQDDPKSAEALYGLGSAYLQQQKNAEAREYFEKARAEKMGYPGTLPNIWNNLGILSAREGKTDEAIENFEHALQIDADHPIALVNLGSAYRQKHDWDNAERVLRSAVELNPDDPEANYGLGMVFAQKNDADHAQEFLQKAVNLRPVYPEALSNLGVLYLRTGKRDEGKKCFEDSIRVAPNYEQAYVNLATVYAIEGDKEKAREVAQQLLERNPNSAAGKKILEQLGQ
jgi:tetratricopeptide (TPR) repeat protein